MRYFYRMNSGVSGLPRKHNEMLLLALHVHTNGVEKLILKGSHD